LASQVTHIIGCPFSFGGSAFGRPKPDGKNTSPIFFLLIFRIWQPEGLPLQERRGKPKRRMRTNGFVFGIATINEPLVLVAPSSPKGCDIDAIT
jgi:hypothetical protein